MDTLIRKIAKLAESNPNKAAIIFKQDTVTYHELYMRIIAAGELLKKEGINVGDRVCFTALSKPEMVVLYLGIQLISAVPVFLDKNATAENMLAIYEDAEAAILLTDKPLREFSEKCNHLSLREIYTKACDNANNIDAIEEVELPTPTPDDLAEILFTTGTTGKPKGVMLSYNAVYHIFQNTISGIHIAEDEVLLLPLPLNHSFALRVLRAVLYRGATLVLQNGFTFAKAVEENITQHHCTALACVATSYEVMKTQMQDAIGEILAKLRFIEFGAGAVSIRQRREICALLPNVQIYNTWGSSESGGAVFCDVTDCVRRDAAGEAAVIGSLGRPLAGEVEVAILSPKANDLEPEALSGHLADYFLSSSECGDDHPGRMALRGAMQMSGYWKNPDLTAQTLIDGWLLTGDLAYLDDAGNVYMLGRADDLINVGGEKVSPLEVEEIAGEYPGIRECACVGAEDPEGLTGQIPVLFVVTRPDYNEDELLRFLAGKMERYKLPGKIVKIEEIPRNRIQKIDRKALKAILEKSDGEDLMNPTIETILSRRSIRRFTDEEIPQAILEMLIKCGTYAPSGHNMQTWHFSVLTKAEDIAKLREAAKDASAKEGVHFYGWENPKALILISNDSRNQDGCQDASCAAENIMLAARSYGLGSVWLNPLMTLRDVSPVKEVLDELKVSKNHVVWATIALGYSAAEGALLKKKTDVVDWL